MKTIRPHQERSIVALRQSLSSGKKRPLLQLPTGAGKTFVAANIIRMAREKKKTVCFCVPAISLIDQTVQEFFAEGIEDIGVIQANHPMCNYSKPVQVASIQTLQARGVPLVDFVIVDEAHKMFSVIGEWMSAELKTPFIGLSATPWAKGLGKFYDDLIVGCTMRQLIEEGYLSDYRVFAPSHPDLSGVKMTAGDYNQRDLGDVMNDTRLVADVVSTWAKLGEGRPTLCFAVDCAHAKALQEQFQSRGIGAGYIDAHTDLVERKFIEKQLARGEISVVCNVGCLTTGVDWDVRCIILARPTRSEMLFVQMIGRGLRTADGKDDCLILDHSDNHTRMGFASNISHNELCDGVSKKNKAAEKKEPLPKECGKCSFLKAPKQHECPACGFKPEKVSEVEFEDGELIEVKPKPKPRPVDKQVFYYELLGYAKERGKSEKFALAMFRNRFNEWPYNKNKALPLPPSPATISYIRSRQIAFAKSRAA